MGDGVLAYFGMDIHRGQAMTTPDGLVLDVFQFSDEEGFLRQNAGATAEITRMLEAVVAGTVDVPTLLRGKERSLLYKPRRQGAPVVPSDRSPGSAGYTAPARLHPSARPRCRRPRTRPRSTVPPRSTTRHRPQ